MDLIRLTVLPPPDVLTPGQSPEEARRRTLSRLMITAPATRIVKNAHTKSTAASVTEVFLCPRHASRFAIHYPPPRKK